MVTAKNQINSGQLLLPKITANKVKEPIMAARMTLGESPTNHTKPIINITVSTLMVRLLKNKSRVSLAIFTTIEIFMPDKATICSVPVVMRS